MRGLIAAVFIGASLIGAPFQSRCAEPARPNVVLFVVGGLRPGMVNEQTTPAMVALLKSGVTFTNTHAMFPTLAMPNAAAMATGHLPGETGCFGDTIYTGFTGAGASVTPSVASGRALGDLDDHFAGDALNEETILRAAAAAGFSTASIGSLGPSLLFDHTNRTGQQTIVVNDQTGHPGGIPLSSDMQAAFQEFGVAAEAPPIGDDARAGDPTKPTPPSAGDPTKPVPAGDGATQQSWFADVASLAVLPTFKERHKPFVIVFWSRDPEAAPRDQADTSLRLIPGINGPAFLPAIRHADNELGRLLTALKELGLASTTNVILASDHGLSTISKETATSYAAGRTYKDVPAALLPPGFVAIDLAHVLRMSLFDPDATGDAKNTPVPAGSFPLRGNGLIGDEPGQPQVVVTANGGSDLIYLPNPDKLMAERIVQFLSAQDYVSGLFVDSRLGSIGGTLPLSALALEGTTSIPGPAIVVNFRTFSTGCADPTACGVAVADTLLQQGQGTAGSFGRADTKIVMGAAGPGFRLGFLDPAPVSTADIGRTIAALLGLKLTDHGKLIGRVLTEAMPHGAPVWAKAGVLRSAPDDSGRVTVLKYQTVGATRYFDSAGYPGRTLGLD